MGLRVVGRCTAKPWVTRGLACALGCVSFLIVWSEATIASGTSPDLSPFSHVRPSPLHLPLVSVVQFIFMGVQMGWSIADAWLPHCALSSIAERQMQEHAVLLDEPVKEEQSMVYQAPVSHHDGGANTTRLCDCCRW